MLTTPYTMPHERYGMLMRKDWYTLSKLSQSPEVGSTSTSPSNDHPNHPLTGEEMMDRILADPNSLDRFLDRDPHALPLTDLEILDLIRIERAKRVQWNIKQEKRAMKKQGIEE